ncbi:MAG: hypothetical protein ABR520_03055 [Mycobacteriales bacterium]|nr:glycoside hydrolase [Frankia sp.]
MTQFSEVRGQSTTGDSGMWRELSRSRGRIVVGMVAGVVLAVAGTALSTPPPNGLPTTSTAAGSPSVTEVWPRFDARGRRAGSVRWRVTTSGGNCCEVLVAATKAGRLVEFGGSYPYFSDDQGRTWTRVQPVVPNVLSNGEGTIVMAPGGDIVGVGWDPYSGDRLQPFLYDADTKTWVYSEHPLHEPFYDREWVAVAKGPFTIAGQTVPWVSMVLSNFSRVIVLVSIDGLNYVEPTERDLDALRNARVEKYLDPRQDDDFDYMQEHAETGLVPLPGGGALSFDNALAPNCGTQILTGDGSWACFGLPERDFTIRGALHTDSRGWLHEVQAQGTDLSYRISRDGGRSWRTAELALPGNPAIEFFDFKAHGKLGLTAIVVHARKADEKHQDMVVRVDTKTGTPRLIDTLYVGDGDKSFTSGLDVQDQNAPRVDFATVAILPDGTIAAGFADKTYPDPALAILE